MILSCNSHNKYITTGSQHRPGDTRMTCVDTICSLQSQYRARWIVAEKRETRALYWPRSWPRRSAASPLQTIWWGTVSLRLRRGQMRVAPSLLPLLSFLGGRFVLCRFSSAPVFVEARRAGRAGGASYRRGGYLRLWFSVGSQEKRGREGREERRGEERERERQRLGETRVVNREGKLTATTVQYIVSNLNFDDRFFGIRYLGRFVILNNKY